MLPTVIKIGFASRCSVYPSSSALPRFIKDGYRRAAESIDYQVLKSKCIYSFRNGLHPLVPVCDPVLTQLHPQSGKSRTYMKRH